MEINFKTSGICCREMNFSVDENNTITDVEFVGGCNGNLSGMAKLLIGQNALEVANIFKKYLQKYSFKNVVFAIPRGKDKNFEAFKQVF